MMLSGGEVAVKLAGSVAKNTCVVRDELAERLASYYGNDRIALGGSNHSRRGVHFNDSIM